MSDKNFKVKSGLNIPIASAKILTTDSSGNVSSSETLAISAGGTGQTTAANALNALLPLQTSNDNYYLQTNGVSSQWSKVYNQTIKNAGVSVSPRGTLNVVGATFTDDSVTDTTTITFTDTTGVSTSGGSTITSSSDSVKGLIIKGTASQTANLQEWQTSAGTVISYITSSGQFASSRAYLSEASVGPDYTTGTQGYLKVSTYSPTKPQITVRAIASQSANLQEWQSSGGTVISKIQVDGSIRSRYFGDMSDTTPYIDFSSNKLTVNARNASYVGLVVQGVASQSANLQEWQNSAGTSLVTISSIGNTWFKAGARVSGNYGGTQALLVQNDQNIIGITVKGNSTQTANLQEWQDSSGNLLAAIRNDGVLRVSQIISKENYSSYFSFASGSPIQVNPLTAETVGLLIKGAASQTANLQEWQNSSGTVVAYMRGDGLFSSYWGYHTYIQPQSGVGSFMHLTNNGIRIEGYTDVANIVFSVKGMSGQTGDLQQWQNSSGTILSKVDSNGIIYSPTAASGTNTTQVATTEFVQTAVSNLIDSAPNTLDTLNEIAAALNDDPNFSSTISTLTTALSSQDTYALMGVY